MAAEKQQLSITLPRGFHFHYTDGQQPKTPEPQEVWTQTIEPPKLPRPTYRVRRRRGPLPSYDVHANAYDMPIPSIETSEATLGTSFSNLARPQFLEGYLQPGPIQTRLFSPPKTPVAQTLPDWAGLVPLGDWSDVKTQGDNISRPSSSCSGMSDSSLYSSLSYGGSCTSPEDECDDPFAYTVKRPEVRNTQARAPPTATPGPLKRKSIKPFFTKDMDTHLWLTYMRYLQDPTVTPFKMLPGVAPPQGVCRRVARDARRNWRGPRTSLPPRSSTRRAVSPDNVRPSKSGSATPTVASTRRPYIPWPRNDAATRSRLRDIIKRKPTLSAHYTRLVHARTPSPFPSPQPPSRVASPAKGTHSSFSRDMNVSLVTSTASSMQAGNPLSTLAKQPSYVSSSDDVFDLPSDRPMVPHQKSQSLHIRTTHNASSSAGNFRSLRSPFSGRCHRADRAVRLGNTNRGTSRASSPLHEPLPLSRAFKRRALYPLDATTVKDESSRESAIQELFGAPAETSHRRIRSRGFSLGDTGDGARNLSQLFTPPSLYEPPHQTRYQNPRPTQQTSANLLAAIGHSTVRLGSPFGGASRNVRFNNTFPRNFTPCHPEDAHIFDSDF